MGCGGQHLLDDLLARLVLRVGLAGEDELHRPVGVAEDFGGPVDVCEDERGPLVGCEAAGKADGERAVAPAGRGVAEGDERRRGVAG